MWSERVVEAILLVEDVASRNGVTDAFYVGGYPRALAMGLGLDDVHDLDVASGSADGAAKLAGLVAEAARSEVELLHRTMTSRTTVKGVEMDFQGPMAHEDVGPWIHLWGVEDTPLARNIFDRDFTINALAIPVGGNQIMDVTGRGMMDISREVIASILPAKVAVPKNPLMITRAVKFSLRYGYEVDAPLAAAMRENAPRLAEQISPERLAIEAYVMSKIDGAAGPLEELGLGFLNSQRMAEVGEELADE